ncbi:hypothetical protein [Gaetbulibacter aestuarii]|uniref:Uncharacterized protein n=1 Tax=Gaetbulibacter aestuarii TaxID=1502358 RepID=A0ABW7MVR4_9FLAO
MKKQITLLFTLGLLTCSMAISQEVNFEKFINEIQKTNSEAGEINLTWWIPKEFWEVTFKREKTMQEDQIEELLEILDPYVIFAVVDGEVGPFGGLTYTPSDSIAKTIKIIDTDNVVYRPIETNNLNPNIQNLLSAFKPILKNMMGQLGENMNFYVFSDRKDSNERLADPLTKGQIQLAYCKKNFIWKFPIGSLLPLKTCPVDNELLNGSWNYCPFHGEALITKG